MRLKPARPTVMGPGTDLYTSELTIHVFCSPRPMLPDASCGEYVMWWGLVLGVAHRSRPQISQHAILLRRKSEGVTTILPPGTCDRASQCGPYRPH